VRHFVVAPVIANARFQLSPISQMAPLDGGNIHAT